MNIWKCSVFYHDSTFVIPGANVKSIPFVETGRPFAIPGNYGIASPRSKRTNDAVEAYDFLQSIIGEEVSFMYSPPLILDKSTSEYVSFAFPSLRLGFPKSLELSYSQDSTTRLLVYVPGLKRVLDFTKGNSLSSSTIYCYKVVDGIIESNPLFNKTNSTPIPSLYGKDSTYSRAIWWCYNGDFSTESLTNGNNISQIVIEGNGAQYSILVTQRGLSIDNSFSLLFSDYSPPDINIPENPYEPGGDSGEGGGGGTFDDDSDSITDSSIPTISSANTGFTRIYNPTLSQVQDLAQYLWTDETVIQTIWNHIKQYFEDPMQAIIGFNLVPCAVPNGGTKNFALMYIDTGVQMTVAANQFVDVDCGTLELKEYFGSALDYSPYTKIACFLPFIGTVQLNTDEVMKNTLQVKYRIDVCSGSCVAKILVSGNVLYQYSGHCAIPIPLSSADFSSYVSAAVSVAKLAIGAAVGGGMGALMAGADNPTQQTNQVVTTTQTTETGRNPATGRQITLGTRTTVETRESPADQSSTQASFSGLSPTNIANTVGQIMTAKPYVEHSGSFSGNTGYLGVRRPYLIIQRPNMCMPNQYQSFNGFPSMITEEFSSLKGFTRVQQVQLTGMSATNPEQAEILEFLKSGVII